MYLPVWIEEPRIGCLEFALTWCISFKSSVLALIHSWFPAAVLLKSEWIDSVWAAKEVVIFRVSLNIFPSGVGPPAWNELKVLFWWHTIILILNQASWVESTRILRSSSDRFSAASETSLKILWASKLFYVILHSFSKNKLMRNYTIT